MTTNAELTSEKCFELVKNYMELPTGELKEKLIDIKKIILKLNRSATNDETMQKLQFQKKFLQTQIKILEKKKSKCTH